MARCKFCIDCGDEMNPYYPFKRCVKCADEHSRKLKEERRLKAQKKESK